MRKHYMTLCTRNNTEVTHILRDDSVEVTFEQAVYGGFHTLVVMLDGTIISNDGFNDSDKDFFLRFLKTNEHTILKEARGEI